MKFDREELFWHYHNNTNPFVIVTVSIDVSNVVNYCKKYRNYYATMGYLVTKSANQIDAFKWRYEEGNFNYYENIFPNFTQKLNDNKIGYFDCEYMENYDTFIENFNNIQEEFYRTEKNRTSTKKGTIWVSCIPWFSIKSLIPPFDRNNTTPQFIWDKYEEKEGKYTMNIMIMAHHGFVDGFHIAKFLEILNNEIENFKEIERL